MDYQTALEGFLAQFNADCSVVNADKLRPFKHTVIIGMGGSRLAPDMLRMLHHQMGIRIHSDYGLPVMDPAAMKDTLFVANSHSGNTAEAISAAEMAFKQGLNLAIVTTGGELKSFAEQNQLPHIITPSADVQPRLAFGYDFAALAKLLGITVRPITDADGIAARSKQRGTKMAEMFDGKIPLIFGPRAWMESVYVWKIALNETAKVPAYCNRLPEMDHNEIAGYNFDNGLCRSFSALILREPGDERMAARIAATADLLRQAGIEVEVMDIPEGEPLARAAELALSAHWTAYQLAVRRDVDPISVPVIEKLKEELKTAAR